MRNFGKGRYQSQALGLQSIRDHLVVDRRMDAVKRTGGKGFFGQAQGLNYSTAKAMRL